MEAVVGGGREGAEGVAVGELEEGVGLGAFTSEVGVVGAEAEAGVVPAAIGALADEEVGEVRRIFFGEGLVDDPVAVFHEEEFVADPVGKGAGGGAGLEVGGLGGDPGLVGGALLDEGDGVVFPLDARGGVEEVSGAGAEGEVGAGGCEDRDGEEDRAFGHVSGHRGGVGADCKCGGSRVKV